MSQRHAVTQAIGTRRKRADKAAKGVILDELQDHRMTPQPRPQSPGRRGAEPTLKADAPKADADTVVALRLCWAMLGAPPGKRLALKFRPDRGGTRAGMSVLRAGPEGSPSLADRRTPVHARVVLSALPVRSRAYVGVPPSNVWPGMDAMSWRVYSSRGLSKISSGAPLSTTRPERMT